MACAALLPLLVVLAPAPGQMETTHVDEGAWLAGVRAKIAARLKVAPEDLRISPGRRWVAVVRSPPLALPRKKTQKQVRKPRRPPPPRRHRIVVVDVDGRRPITFAPVTVRGSDEPPKELRGLDDARLLYEVVLPPRPPTAPATPAPPTQLFVIQPVRRRARPLRCEGTRFTVAERLGRLAFVSGPTDAARIMIDGRRVYPASGAVSIVSDLAWSKDGPALAFLETDSAGARLVMLADVDNRSGDTTWELPPTLPVEGMRVFWAGPDKLVVGKRIGAPTFAVSFQIERPAP